MQLKVYCKSSRTTCQNQKACIGYPRKYHSSESARATLDYGLSKMKLPLIIGRAHVDNLSSIRVLENIGMQFSREEIFDDCMVRTYTIGT
jgi:RimJ/RimL family protein N-acetyltransferase